VKKSRAVTCLNPADSKYLVALRAPAPASSARSLGLGEAGRPDQQGPRRIEAPRSDIRRKPLGATLFGLGVCIGSMSKWWTRGATGGSVSAYSPSVAGHGGSSSDSLLEQAGFEPLVPPQPANPREHSWRLQPSLTGSSSPSHSASLVQPSRIKYSASSADITTVPSSRMFRYRPEYVCTDPMPCRARRRTQELG